jgi:hypothetical protein
MLGQKAALVVGLAERQPPFDDSEGRRLRHDGQHAAPHPDDPPAHGRTGVRAFGDRLRQRMKRFLARLAYAMGVKEFAKACLDQRGRG